MAATALDWSCWQLVDSALPSGGLPHSLGLEAAWQLGMVARDGESDGDRRPLDVVVVDLLENAASQFLPFVRAANADPSPEGFARADELCDACVLSEVASRASRMQGAALLVTASKCFSGEGLARVKARVRAENLPSHHACVFGALCANLGVEAATAERMYVFITLRSLFSAAVRLGVVGPLEAQRMQHALAPTVEEVCARHGGKGVDEACATSPLADIVQGMHDRLDARMFNS